MIKFFSFFTGRYKPECPICQVMSLLKSEKNLTGLCIRPYGQSHSVRGERGEPRRNMTCDQRRANGAIAKTLLANQVSSLGA